MVVASIALFVALGGTSIAAVSYARNAGKVDNKDAVASSATLSQAAGNLVATASRGPNKGRFPSKYLTDVARTQGFGRTIEVTDNAVGAQEPFAGSPGLGTLTANCADQNGRAGAEDPISSIQFVNQAGQTLNVTRLRGPDEPVIPPLAHGTGAALTIGGSNGFEYQVQLGAATLLIQGTIRQDGRNTPAAGCVLYGTVLRVG